MNLAFTHIIRKVFEDRIFPAISEIVEGVVSILSMKGKVTLQELKRINLEIHRGVMHKLFTPVNSHRVLRSDFDSDDDDDDQ